MIKMETKDELKKLASNIKAERNRKGLSQAQLAEHIQASENSIGKIERAEQNPSAIMVHRIAKTLEISIEELFKGIE